MNKILLKLLGGMWVVLAPAMVVAFAEDIQVAGGALANCVTLDAGICGALPGRSRSLIHMDSTFYLAQALGFRKDVAYWIAAYDQATDQGQYVPFDTSLQPAPTDGGVPTRCITENIDGFQRSSPSTGGTGYHFVLPFSFNDGADLDALGMTPFYPYYQNTDSPDGGAWGSGSDFIHEGTLSHLRRWAFTSTTSSTPPMCTYGFTLGTETLGYYQANQCSLLPISGNNPLNPGAMLISTTGSPQNITSTGPAYDQLQALLTSAFSAGRGQLWMSNVSGKEPVPAELVRMGIYLHALADTISHQPCGEGSYAMRGDGGFQLRYQGVGCSDSAHTLGHYQELGPGAATSVPLRTYNALDYVYRELAAFKGVMQMAHSDWFVTRDIPETAIVGRRQQGDGGFYDGDEFWSAASPMAFLRQSGAAQRVSRISSDMRALDPDGGISAMPGSGGWAVSDCR